MPREYRFYVQIAVTPILCIALGKVGDKFAENLSVLTGIAFAALMLIMLYDVYSMVRYVVELQKGKDKTEENKPEESGTGKDKK